MNTASGQAGKPSRGTTPQPQSVQAGTELVTARTRRRRARHRTIKDLNRNTRGGRRAVELMRQFECELGGNLTKGQMLAVERAAVMTAIAEDARIRKLNGATDVNLDDLVRLDRTAALAVQKLGITGKPAKPEPSLAEYLAGRTDVT